MTGLLLAIALVAQGPDRDSLSLAEALSRARSARTLLAQGAAAVAEARAARRQIGAVPNPIANYQYTGDAPRQHVLLDQPLSWIAVRGADRAAGAARILIAVNDSAQLARDLDADVRTAFYGAVGARRLLELAMAQASYADSLARIASLRLAAGDISVFERDQIALEATRAGQRASAAFERDAVAVAFLARAIGWPAPEGPVAVGALDAGLDSLPRLELDLSSVTAVRVAIADSQAASAELRSARRARLPIPNVQIGANWDDPAVLGASPTTIAAGITVPIPFWNRYAGTVGVARARLDAATARAVEVRLEVNRRITVTRRVLIESARRARAGRDSLLPAAASLRAKAIQAYRSGSTGVLPVLDALRTERDVQIEVFTALQEFQTAHAEWRRLTSDSR
jgi:cobalt-zinc-cadmium efflux system outer membrane protein